MKIRLIENGLDSLKKGYSSLRKYEEMYFINRSGKERYFVLKDAVLSIHHGIEILFKEVLKRKNELLVFSQIDKDLKNAFVEQRQRHLESVFDTGKKISTVDFKECIDRVEKICGFEIKPHFKSRLEKIAEYRNQITHSEVALNENEINSTFEGLIDEIDMFFVRAIGQEYKTITGHSELKNNYQDYLNKLKEAKMDKKKETISKFFTVFDQCSLSMGQYEVKYINDINLATKIIDKLYESTLKFGTDIYNYHCSGDVSKMWRLDESRFAMYTTDNRVEYWFKFKSMLIYMPKIDSDYSPIIFFEADADNVDDSHKKFIEERDKVNFIVGIKFIEEDRVEWDPKKREEFYYNLEYDEYYSAPEYCVIHRLISEGIVCFLNVQGLHFDGMKTILYNSEGKSLKQTEILIRKELENGQSI